MQTELSFFTGIGCQNSQAGARTKEQQENQKKYTSGGITVDMVPNGSPSLVELHTKLWELGL